MGDRSSPEQILGNLFQFVINLRKRNIAITRRTQALGSACVDTLRRDGWVIVRHDEMEKLRRERDEAALRYIEASNPGIDIEQVRREFYDVR